MSVTIIKVIRLFFNRGNLPKSFKQMKNHHLRGKYVESVQGCSQKVLRRLKNFFKKEIL